MSVVPYENSPTGNHSEETTWWNENRDLVEAKFINLLRGGETHSAYNGPERRSSPTPIPSPLLAQEDIALARSQADRLGMRFEEYVCRLFHEAVLAEEAEMGH